MEKLTLEKRGMDFYGDPATASSDVGNYRVGIYGEKVRGKSGRLYSIEFSRWCRRTYRTTNKKTGKPLKKAVWEVLNPCGLYVSIQYREDKGDGFEATWADLKLMEELAELQLDYTIQGIEAALEYITGKPYKISIEA